MMQKEFRTILKQATAELEEKKSRFIANVKPITCDEEAAEYINRLKTKYWDASHNVYAYYVCGDSIIQRFSDDGEPSGTAGLPVLEAIKKRELQNLVVVVTRYFGGTLLGTAGLMRAYGRSASLGIEAAGIITRIMCLEIKVVIEYPILGKLQNYLFINGYSIKNIEYTQDVEITVTVPVNDKDQFIDFLNEAANGYALIEIIGEIWENSQDIVIHN